MGGAAASWAISAHSASAVFITGPRPAPAAPATEAVPPADSTSTSQTQAEAPSPSDIGGLDSQTLQSAINQFSAAGDTE